jgi:hypothetical protein
LGDILALKDEVGRILRGDFLAAFNVDIGNDYFGTFFAESSSDSCAKSITSS